MKNELVKVNGVEIEVKPDVEHEWLLSTKDVAEGYGLTRSGLSKAISRYEDELDEGRHYINVTDSQVGGRPSIMWTKRGVVRLGFFIKTPMAKEFRDWAEDYIVNERAPKAQKEVRLTPAEMLLQQAQLMLDMERKTSELEEGKHFINVTNIDIGGKQKVRMLTKRDVVRLGVFIKTPMAKEFR